MINRGNIEISEVHLGDTRIDKIHLGEQLIWPTTNFVYLEVGLMKLWGNIPKYPEMLGPPDGVGYEVSATGFQEKELNLGGFITGEIDQDMAGTQELILSAWGRATTARVYIDVMRGGIVAYSTNIDVTSSSLSEYSFTIPSSA